MASAFLNVGAHYEDYMGNPYILMQERFSNSKGLLLDVGSTIKQTATFGDSFCQTMSLENATFSDCAEIVSQCLETLCSAKSFNESNVASVILPPTFLNRHLFGLKYADYLLSQKGISTFVSLFPVLKRKGDISIPKEHEHIDKIIKLAVKEKCYGICIPAIVHTPDKMSIQSMVARLNHEAERAYEVGLLPLLKIDIDSNLDGEADEALIDSITSMLDALGDRNIAISIDAPHKSGLFDELLLHPNVEKTFLSTHAKDLSVHNKILRDNPGFNPSVNSLLLESAHRGLPDVLFNDRVTTNINSIINATKHVI